MEYQIRLLILPVAAAFLIVNSAFAANVGPLSAGKPAGVRKAQDGDVSHLVYIGLVAAGIGIALAVSDNGRNAAGPTPTTTVVSTSTTS